MVSYLGKLDLEKLQNLGKSELEEIEKSCVSFDERVKKFPEIAATTYTINGQNGWLPWREYVKEVVKNEIINKFFESMTEHQHKIFRQQIHKWEHIVKKSKRFYINTDGFMKMLKILMLARKGYYISDCEKEIEETFESTQSPDFHMRDTIYHFVKRMKKKPSGMSRDEQRKMFRLGFEIDGLKAKLKTHSFLRKKFETENETLKKRATQAESGLEELKKRVKLLETESQPLKKRVKRAEKQNQALMKRFKRMQTDQEKMKVEDENRKRWAKKVKKSYDKLKNSYEKQKKANKELKEENEKLKEENQKLNDLVESLKKK